MRHRLLTTHLRHRLAIALLISVTGAAAGCNDPYSQRRIDIRMRHLSATAASIESHEAQGAQRVDDDAKTLEKWWKSDCERFNRKAPTIGDYIW